MKRGGFTSGKRGGSVSGQRGSTSEIAGLVLLVVLVSTTVTFMVLVSHRLSDLSDWHIGRLAGPRSQASADTPLATPAAADTPAAAPPAADSLATSHFLTTGHTHNGCECEQCEPKLER